MSRQDFIFLAKHYFGDELADVDCPQQVSFEEAYQTIRKAVATQRGTTVLSEPLRFTSEPLDGEFDMSKLEFP